MQAHRPDSLGIHGVLLLDKPVGMTSNQALQIVKRIYRVRKAGHTGSLDPIASGLVPLCLGEATKISRFVIDADKRYWAALKLGQSTDTGDAEGRTIETRAVEVTRRAVERALRRFRGEIEQVPPMFSAIKRGGQPLYKLARRGIEVQREPRRVAVHALNLVALRDDVLELEIHCSRGFYVRSLAADLGNVLGCGAHVTALRRLAVGRFSVQDAVTLERLRAIHDRARLRALLIPVDEGLRHLPSVRLSRDAAYCVCRGQPVRAPRPPDSGWVRLYTETDRFIGVGVVLEDGRVAPKRLFHHA